MSERQSTRRKFLQQVRNRRRRARVADDSRRAPTRPARSSRSSAPASTPTRSITTGASCRRGRSTATRTASCEDSQGQIYVHHTVNGASESADSMVVFDRKGKFVALVGQGVQGRRARPPHPQGRPRRIPLPLRHEARRGREDDAEGRRGASRSATRRSRTSTRRTPTARPASSTRRPTSPSSRTATSTSATATARASSTSTRARASSSARSAARARRPGQLDCPHGLWSTRASAWPTLMVADRGNKRLQVFTLGGEHVRFIEGTNYPCHFSERKGERRHPRPLGARHAARSREQGDRAPRRSRRRFVEGDPQRPARRFPGRQVRLPARRLLRPRRQHLRRRMGRGGTGDETEESVSVGLGTVTSDELRVDKYRVGKSLS